MNATKYHIKTTEINHKYLSLSICFFDTSGTTSTFSGFGTLEWTIADDAEANACDVTCVCAAA